MRGGDGSEGFSKWGDELPLPEELMPLSQTLITPDLALAFSIGSPRSPQLPLQPPPQSAAHSSQHNFSAEFESPEFCASGGVAGGDEPARTLKRPRLVWTPQLHKRFVDAVAHLGIKNAVPKTIMQLMSVDGLTRENVASHLQKYRLYLKRMQGISAGGHASDPVTDHLFATSPVPPHFLHPGQPTTPSDHFMPFVPMPAAMHHHQMQHQFRHFGGSPTNGNGHLELPFMRQPPLSPTISMPPPIHRTNSGAPLGYAGDLDPADGRKILTLFPTGDD